MEHYRTFFPTSSSSLASLGAVSSDYPSPNMVNFDVFNRLQGTNQNGFSLKSENRAGSLLSNSFPDKSSKKKIEKKVRNPRYAFQTRSQVDILDDGYRWRKYGQKTVKNNKHPRSYYRCTYQGCNVKKQVQRLSKDQGVVVTTYEGMHSHQIEKNTDNFEHILSQMQIYPGY